MNRSRRQRPVRRRSARCRRPRQAAASTTVAPSAPTTAEDVAVQLAYARKVIVVPGYGLAVAQAQHDVRELAEAARGARASTSPYAHPPGRRPDAGAHERPARRGQRAVRPAQGDGRDQPRVRADGRRAGRSAPTTSPTPPPGPTGSPIYGMPILDVDKARAVIVMKRSMRPGFAGIDNELYLDPEDDDAVRRREGLGRQADRRREGALMPVQVTFCDRSVRDDCTTRVDQHDPRRIELRRLLGEPSDLVRAKVDRPARRARRDSFVDRLPIRAAWPRPRPTARATSARAAIRPASSTSSTNVRCSCPSGRATGSQTRCATFSHNPHVGLLFVVPGVGDTLAGQRPRGARSATRSCSQPLAVEGKAPKLGILVEVDEVFTHCSKAFLRVGPLGPCASRRTARAAVAGRDPPQPQLRRSTPMQYDVRAGRAL